MIAAFIVQATPIVFMLGISTPAYLCAMLYNKTFKRFEPEEEIIGDDEWTMAPLEGEEEAAAQEEISDAQGREAEVSQNLGKTVDE